MEKSFVKFIEGYKTFKQQYAMGSNSTMRVLAKEGQQPQALVICCCDSRVDPAVLLQCDPGDLFIVRNVANIVPPYESDELHHGTSAAMEFAVCYLQVKHIIIIGHSQCGGINAALNGDTLIQNDFIGKWVELIAPLQDDKSDVDSYAKKALHLSYNNLLTFPWIKQKVESQQLMLHRWFFDIATANIVAYDAAVKKYIALEQALDNKNLI